MRERRGLCYSPTDEASVSRIDPKELVANVFFQKVSEDWLGAQCPKHA